MVKDLGLCVDLAVQGLNEVKAYFNDVIVEVDMVVYECVET